jgi:RNA polymerase sigma-70 factor (ECF subfamily)
MDFADLYEKYARDVHRFALFLSGNEAVADDLTAETFTRALLGKDDLRLDTVKAYLLAIARNLYRDACRREWRQVPLDAAPDRADRSPDPEAMANDGERLRAVLEAMARLPVAEREALVLAVDRELTYEQIAAIVGASPAAVKVRVHRARLRLKSILETKERS